MASSGIDLREQLIERNDQIREDFAQWRIERRHDLFTNLLQMAKFYSTHWTKISLQWNKIIHELDASHSPMKDSTQSPILSSTEFDDPESIQNDDL